MNKKLSFTQKLRTAVGSLIRGGAMAALMLVAAQPAAAQSNATQTVQGVVTDETGQPLIGTTVLVQGTAVGTTTDAKGHYKISAKPTNTLSFQYLGYTTQTAKVGAQTLIDIQLKPDASTALDEVVVIGYGQVKKSDLTGSVANVKMSDVRDVPVVAIDQALQGRIAGADIMSTSGEPGATTSIRIRGTRSISADNEPLIVVDGVMDAVKDLNDINSADIEAISVLKDASSTAIYGSRGANGVIIITTKQGSSTSSKPNITFKADAGVSMLPRRLDIMNSTEYAQYRNDYAYFSTADNSNITPETPLMEGYPYKDPYSYGKGTDWVGEIARVAPYQNYNLSVSGGSKKTTYYTSFGYTDSQGIIKASGQQRLTGRLNLSHQLFEWLKLGVKSSYTYIDTNPNKVTIGGTSWWNGAIFLSPMIGSMSDWNPLWNNGSRFNSPLILMDQVINNQKRHTINNTFSADVKLAKGLTFSSQFSYYLYQEHKYYFEPSTLPMKGGIEGAKASRNEHDSQSLLSENTLNYQFNRKDSPHTFNALVGFTGQRTNKNYLNLEGNGYLIDDLTWNNMGGIADKENYKASTENTKVVMMSVLGRFNYDFKKRYYLTFTARYDGASNFAKNKKWAFFPSAALMWNIANEPFMKNVKWLENLSLRASAGRTGNSGIKPYQALMTMGNSTGGYLFGGSQPVAYYPNRLASPNLTWETSDQYNIALEASAFDGRLNFSAEGYIIKTKDLLLTVQEARQTGYSSYFSNAGATTNKGWELTIDTRNIQTRKFTWSTTLTISHNKQNVDNICTEDYVTAYESKGSNPYMMYGYVQGYPLNALWGFKYAGTWKDKEEIERNKTTKAYMSSTNSYLSPGCPRYVDINHDGKMSREDLVYLGSSDPDLYGGLQNNFRIGNLNIGVFFAYSLGGKIYNISEQWMGGSSYTNQYRYMLNAWHPVRNPQSDVPRAGAGEQTATDRYVYDASFLRLKNVSISYKFDMRKVTRNHLNDITLTLSGENLYLWKRYNGFDPDVSTSSSNSALRRLDNSAYPKPRTITFSIQIRY